jgi:prepilin-type processing-associated H-X9-DG protein
LVFDPLGKVVRPWGKSVASSRYGLNVACAISADAEGATKRRYLNRQIAFLDGHVRPHGVHDLALGNEFPRPVKEEMQKIRCPRPERNRRRRAVVFNP